MSKNYGGPAFPFEYHNQTAGYRDGFFETGKLAPGASQQFAGMTLRDYFAAKANIEVYAPVDSLYRKLGRNPTVDEMAAWIAEVRFIEADAMLLERAK